MTVLQLLKEKLIGTQIQVWTNGIPINGQKENSIFSFDSKGLGLYCPTQVQCFVKDVTFEDNGESYDDYRNWFEIEFVYLKTGKIISLEIQNMKY